MLSLRRQWGSGGGVRGADWRRMPARDTVQSDTSRRLQDHQHQEAGLR